MNQFNQQKFNQFILEQGILGFFPKPIKLVSGRTSSWYVNWRNVSNDVYLIDQLSDFVLSYVQQQSIEINCFYGTPDGATKLAVLCQYKFAKSQPDFKSNQYTLAMGRKTPKDHGEPKDRFFVGAPQGRVVVLEDVTTTGGSLLKAVQSLLDLNIQVSAAIALTNRNENMDNGQHVSDVLADLGVKYYSLSQGLDLLPVVFKRKSPGKKIKQSIIDEFNKYGQQPIKL